MQRPACFGKSWNPRDAECKGGLDPGYTNPSDGTHRREKCTWFQQCGHATQMNNAPAHQPSLIPPHALHQRVSQPQPQPYIPPRPPPGPYGSVHQTPTYAAQPMQQMAPSYGMPATMVAPWVAQQGPTLVPLPQQMPSSVMPFYLTVPEPVDPNVSFLKRVALSGSRSMVKAFCHTVAALVDHTPFTPYRRSE